MCDARLLTPASNASHPTRAPVRPHRMTLERPAFDSHGSLPFSFLLEKKRRPPLPVASLRLWGEDMAATALCGLTLEELVTAAWPWRTRSPQPRRTPPWASQSLEIRVTDQRNYTRLSQKNLPPRRLIYQT
jgi:hypothetical protein